MGKPSHVGAPAIFAIDMAVRPIVEAFENVGCFLVGSAIERPDWRDIDLRLMMMDEDFAILFPNVGANHWEHDPRWLLMTTSISEHLSKVTGLPIDFQFQPMTRTNEQHKGPRHALGLRMASVSDTGKSNE